MVLYCRFLQCCAAKYTAISNSVVQNLSALHIELVLDMCLVREKKDVNVFLCIYTAYITSAHRRLK